MVKEGKPGDKPQVRVRALKLGGDKTEATEDIVVLHGDTHADKAHAELTKRLKAIESELQKIRQVLKRMQDDEDEDD